ncbi:MAG: ankyrin repeat domain-containing protein [Wolbachia sp.]
MYITPKRRNLYNIRLVNRDTSTNTKDKYDNTPLHSVAYTEKLNIVKYLIIEYININAKVEYDKTLLHVATIMQI